MLTLTLTALRFRDADLHVHAGRPDRHHRGLFVSRLFRTLQVPQRPQLQGEGGSHDPEFDL